jgi:diguanylate cyclase (GGDEF)-like protein
MDSFLQEKIDQLKRTKGKRRFALYQIVTDIQRGLEPQERLKYGQEYLSLGYHFSDLEAQANAHNSLGGSYYQLRDLDNAAHHFQQAFELFETLNMPAQVAKLYRNIGIVFWELGDYQEALKYYLRSLAIVEKTEDKKGLARTYNNLGSLYGILNQNADALSYFEKALKLSQTEHLQLQTTYLYNNIGEIYLNTGEPQKALPYFNRSIEEGEKSSETANTAYATLNIAKCYRLLGRFNESKDTLVSCRDAIESGQDRVLHANLLLEFARIEKTARNYKEAVKYLENGLSLSKKTQIKTVALEIYKELTECLPLMKAYSKAVTYYREYLQLKDVYFSEKTAKMVAELEMRSRIIKIAHEAEWLKQKNAELKAAFKKMEQIAKTDTLTHLPNRREITGKLKEQYRLYVRKNAPFSIAIIDIDHFKKVNDSFGHIEGDRVLRKFGKLLRTSLREEDFAGRWGGEEFLLIFPLTTIEEASIITERIRETVEKTSFLPKEKMVPITVTIGLSQINDDMSMDKLLSEADARLYEGKKAGRNRICPKLLSSH